ncbi:hypothetical protein [Flaviaesturariibacter aridisoli]|uniref:Uncharacterized protein n=1 Tax=Flaviaesturariibacter aridisoli TaxID=2545761 RepID=A0A4R4E1X4_9BACT|nr:hypothetical protein [Flaviaesturariibacter aridisoli]TCZ72837.1 hypothetical protein E0486_08645 [Flaviaesturariibacter aridisoli]
MEKIFKCLDNPFDSHLISGPRLYAGGEDLETKARPHFPHLSEEIAAARLPYGRLLGLVEVNDAEKIGGTDAVDDLLTEAARYMVDAEPQVAVSLKKGSVAYKAVYPDNLQTYTRLRKADAPARFEALKEVMENHGGTLPPEMKSIMSGFRAAWDDARAAQNAAEGKLAGSRTERDAARKKLETVLFKALLQLTIECIDDTDRVRDFIDHTILDAHRHSSLEQPATPAV